MGQHLLSLNQPLLLVEHWAARNVSWQLDLTSTACGVSATLPTAKGRGSEPLHIKVVPEEEDLRERYGPNLPSTCEM